MRGDEGSLEPPMVANTGPHLLAPLTTDHAKQPGGACMALQVFKRGGKETPGVAQWDLPKKAMGE